MDISLGQIVRSKAGRDQGKDFIVVQITDEAFVGLADGDLRRIEKPKRKKIKHLEPTGIVLEAVKEKLETGIKVSNSELRKTLAAIKDNETGNE